MGTKSTRASQVLEEVNSEVKLVLLLRDAVLSYGRNRKQHNDCQPAPRTRSVSRLKGFVIGSIKRPESLGDWQQVFFVRKVS